MIENSNNPTNSVTFDQQALDAFGGVGRGGNANSLEAQQDLGRRRFLKGGAIAAAGVALTAGFAQEAEAAPIALKQQMSLVRRHENDHVAYLVQALGANARPKPTFQNLQRSNVNDFLNLSLALENTGVGAYLGAIPAILDKGILSAAASVALIEARHAGFFNGLRSQPMTQNAFDQELSFERAATIQEVIDKAGPYIASLNGGPPLTFNTTTPSASNDVAILNFALALEYLEAEYYNINVPLFYGV